MNLKFLLLRLLVAKGEEGPGQQDWEFEISTCKLVYIGWVNRILRRAIQKKS